MTCEICGGSYTGAYVPPPPPPPPPPHPVLPHLTRQEQEALQHILTRLALVAPPHGGDGSVGAAAGAGSRPGGLRLVEVYDVNDAEYDERQPVISWTAMLATFLLLLLLLHNSLDDGPGGSGVGPDGRGGAGGDAAGGSGGALPGLGPSSGGGGSGFGGDDDGIGAGTGLFIGLLLFGVWVLVKLFMIALPLIAVSRMFHQPVDEEREDAEEGAASWYAASRAAAAATANGAEGRGGSSGAGGEERVGVEMQQVEGSGARHPFLLALQALRHQQWRQQLRVHLQRQREGVAGGGGEGGLDSEGAGAGSARLVGVV